MKTLFTLLVAALVLGGSTLATAAPAKPSPASDYLSPAALALSRNGQFLYIACTTARQVAQFDPIQKKVLRTFPTPTPPTDLVLSADENRLYVTCAGAESRVLVLDLISGRQTAAIAVGHTGMSPVLSADGNTLYVCNRFQSAVSEVNLKSRRETRRFPVPREPVAAALTLDGRFLLVANHLPVGRADVDTVAATVSVLDTKTGQVIQNLALPNGSGQLRGLKLSPDGKVAAVTHTLARFHLPTTQLDRGWMNTSALTLIDVASLRVINTVLLDTVDRGAANPWGLAWSADGKTLVVTHAGTHEVSIIRMAELLDKLAKLPTTLTADTSYPNASATRVATDVPNDLAFLVGLRTRLPLASANGPRGIALAGATVYTANYFSDNLSVLRLDAPAPKAEPLALGPVQPLTTIRRGEMLFNDAGICFQGWQSCASCHSEDGRVDGLNWDLLNDGIGNPKNNRSLLLAHRTRPAMTLRVRETAEAAVRAGVRHILFTVQPEEVTTALDEYLKSLEPLPSPYLVRGKLTPEAQRGAKVFQKAGCAECHPAGLFTDLKPYDVGTAGRFDKPGVPLDTPTLIEIWRTAPYLHDGSAATLEDVITTRNPGDQHGKTSSLTPKERTELLTYLLSI